MISGAFVNLLGFGFIFGGIPFLAWSLFIGEGASAPGLVLVAVGILLEIAARLMGYS